MPMEITVFPGKRTAGYLSAFLRILMPDPVRKRRLVKKAMWKHGKQKNRPFISADFKTGRDQHGKKLQDCRVR